jgi:HD domain
LCKLFYAHFAVLESRVGRVADPPVLGSPRALPQARAALEYARAAHAGQRRKVDGAPFILHPREVASLLSASAAPDHLIAAGALHDVIEKTGVSAADLRERFGSRIATLVEAVSEDDRLTGYAERKAALRDQVARAGEEALTLFAADKISKVRELRIGGYGVHRPPRRRLAHWRCCRSACHARRSSRSSAPSWMRPRRGPNDSERESGASTAPFRGLERSRDLCPQSTCAADTVADDVESGANVVQRSELKVGLRTRAAACTTGA